METRGSGDIGNNECGARLFAKQICLSRPNILRNDKHHPYSSKQPGVSNLGYREFGMTYSLAQGSALANGDVITLFNTESGGDVSGDVLVPLLVPGVLGDEVKVLATDDDGTVHLGGNDSAGQDTATDGDLTSEGALLICGKLLDICC